jgi:ribosomal protein L11 methyltransferase
MFVWSKLSSTKWEDAWEERFHAAANTNLVISYLPGGKRIRVEVYCNREQNALAIQKQFGGTVRELKQQNWAAMSAKSLQPINVRGKLMIAHTEETAAKLKEEHPATKVLCIPGEMAFGTGDHATTSTCLRLLVDYAMAHKGGPWDVLDLGCGTGILALAAKALGAGVTDACDYDPAAVTISKKNAKLNKLPGINFFKQDVLEWTPTRTYNLIAANIFHDVLTAAFPKIAAAAAPNATIFVSGILVTQLESCLAAATAAGLVHEEPIIKGKWATVKARKA